MRASRASVVFRLRAAVLSVASLFALGAISGCQVAPVASGAKLAEFRQQVDASGLVNPISVEPLKASIAPPNKWVALKLQRTLLYTHQQWRSPSRRSAVGISYVRLPVPLSAKTVAWFAQNEVKKRSLGGKLIRQWTDSLGREWFEGETAKYHITGYVMTSGTDAWINYYGYRTTEIKEPAEIELGRKSLDTVVPISVADAMKVADAK